MKVEPSVGMTDMVQPDYKVELRLRRRMKQVAAAFAVATLVATSGFFLAYGYLEEISNVRLEAMRAAELISVQARNQPAGWAFDSDRLDRIVNSVHGDKLWSWYEQDSDCFSNRNHADKRCPCGNFQCNAHGRSGT